MTITSGFGLTLDLERGALRHWTMSDGVRRWVDDGALVQAQMVQCDGWAADNGCDTVCLPPSWPGQYGGKKLCPQCAQRLNDDNRAWSWLTD